MRHRLSCTGVSATQAAGPSHTHQAHTANQSNLVLISLFKVGGWIYRYLVLLLTLQELRVVYVETLDPLMLKQLHLSPLSPAMGTRAGQRRWEANFPAGEGEQNNPTYSLF